MTTNPKRQPAGLRTGGQFATDTKAEAGVTLGTAAARPAPYGGFRFAGLRQMEGRETAAFSAKLMLDGEEVGVVRNDGNGGCSLVHWKGGYHSAAAQALAETASTLYPDRVYEPEEELFSRLLTVEEMNRKRKLAIVTDEDDFWQEGTFREMSSPRGTSREDQLRALDTPAARARGVRVWDKTAGDFIPLDEALRDL